MNIFSIVMLTLYVTHVFTKSKSRRYRESSSDETIENLLYFKDCQKRAKEEPTTPEAPPLTLLGPSLPLPTPPQPQCPFPKMCCALSCGDDCNAGKQSSFIARQMEPIQNNPFQPLEPMLQPQQPNFPSIFRKRKKMKLPQSKMPGPLTSRRFGFTKEKIKSLLDQDDDIRKILKDLVRVTMEKADLMDLQNRLAEGNTGNAPVDVQVNNPSERSPEHNEDADENEYFE